MVGAVLVFRVTANGLAAGNQDAIDRGLIYLRSQQKTDGRIPGFSGVTDWAAQAFSSSGVDPQTVATASGQPLLTYLTNNPPDNLSSASNWERSILTISAAGKNPGNFGGLNYTSKLKTYYTQNQIGSSGLLNDDSFGVLALIAGGESSGSAILKDSLNFLISHQQKDGGFSYSTDGSSDVDDTAATLMALSGAKKLGAAITNLSQSIETAKTYILGSQNKDGGFTYDPNPATSYDTTSNVSSTSWTLMALNSLGLANSSQALSAQNYLLGTQQTDGSFPYQPSYPPGDTFDTSFAILALNGSFWPINIYSGPDISPTVSPIPEISSSPAPTPTPTAATTATPTPTSTPMPTNTPTPMPTVMPTSTATPTPQPKINLTPTPAEKSGLKETLSPTSFPSLSGPKDKSSDGEILGAATNQNNGQPRPPVKPFLLSKLFFGMGLFFLIAFMIGKILF